MALSGRLKLIFHRVPFRPLRCASGSATSTVTVTQEKDGVALLTINNPPVNILDEKTVNAYVKEIRSLDENKECRGVIILSACEKAFSAGLDINIFHDTDVNRLRAYWRSMQDLFFQTYQSRLATVAAVNGAAIAGGCVLALSTDYRIMVNTSPKPLFGLNETKIGLTTPFWINDRTIELIGYRKGEHAILRGTLYNAQDAVAIGFVDRLVGSQNELLDAAKSEMRQMWEIPDHTRSQTKRRLRQPLVEKFQKLRVQDLDDFVEMMSDSRTQAVLQSYLASLTKRKG